MSPREDGGEVLLHSRAARIRPIRWFVIGALVIREIEGKHAGKVYAIAFSLALLVFLYKTGMWWYALLFTAVLIGSVSIVFLVTMLVGMVVEMALKDRWRYPPKSDGPK